MSENQTINLLWGVGALVLVISAVAAHRMSLGQVVRALLGWAAIGLVAFIVVANRHEIGSILAGVSESLGLDDQQVQGETVRIRMASDGHFWARATLNGVQRRMLIDSGATTTAISARTAAAAGIEAGTDGFPVMIETANGTVAAARGNIDQLGIGPLTTDDLDVVVSENFGELDVLGMNFLSRLKSWRVENNVLVLEPGEPSAAGETADATATEGELPKRAPRRERAAPKESAPGDSDDSREYFVR